ncbi:MAG: S8 family serine peptidase [Chloroflexota bacterium]
MLKPTHVVALFCAVGALVVPRVSPAPAIASGSPSVKVIVELRGSPLALDQNLKARNQDTGYHFKLDPQLPQAKAYVRQLGNYQAAEIAYLHSKGINLQVGWHFRTAFNGFSATVPTAELARLQTLRNVTQVLPDRRMQLLDDHSLPLIHATDAWAQLGGGPNAGKGVYIAQLDTGIETSNPCFGGAGFKAPPGGTRADTAANKKLTNNKVVVVRAFGQTPGKKYSAVDTSGHGTFGAAIEACDYQTKTPLGTTMSGVAPAAQLMDYNIAPGGEGGSTDAQILAAIDVALQDGADVINLSFGGSSGDPRLDDEAQAFNAAATAGVPAAISAGNAGPEPQTIGSPATDPNVMAVGATTNAAGVYPTVAVTGSNVPAGLQRIKARQGTHVFSSAVGPALAVYVGLGRLPGDSCTPACPPGNNDYAGKDVTGKIVLIDRGYTTFEDKINHAAKEGAIGAIIMDNRSETELPSMDVKTATLPALAISETDGKSLLSYVQANPSAEITLDPKPIVASETPDVVTDFSSRGHGTNYGIKPDVVAPGEDIYSAAESKSTNHNPDLYSPSGFTSADGTSFSAPHVTGAIALVLQKHAKWTPLEVRSALMNTASTNVYLNDDRTGTPAVSDDGAGLIDVDAAISTPALLTPPSYSFGEVNVGYGPVQRTKMLTLTNVGAGNGQWQLSIHQLQGAPGLALGVPASVTLQGSAGFPFQLNASASTAPGDYDGYLLATKGNISLHIPYFVHLISKPVTKGSVLLVDDTTSRFQPPAPYPPVKHVDVTRYFERSLSDLHHPYTYWNEATLDSPTLADMKAASAVIYYTGANLNDFAPENSDPESLFPPMTATDVSALHSYMNQGGHVFVTGMGAAISDPYFEAIVLGSSLDSFSVYDTGKNDQQSKGGVGPPRPSAVPDREAQVHENAELFSGMKPIDFSDGGDGAGDDRGQFNQLIGTSFGLDPLVGVPGMSPERGSFGPYGHAYGQAVLRSTKPQLTTSGIDVGIASSDEPSFKHKTTYKGRSVLFSFGFEAINNNTGFATRDQVMRRIFQWFNDQPRAHVTNPQKVGKNQIRLEAKLSGPKAATYQWQIGNKVLATSKKPTIHRFPHAGTFSVRVQVTDQLGHVAVSPWAKIKVS